MFRPVTTGTGQYPGPVVGTKKVRDRWLHVSIVIITKKKILFFFPGAASVCA